MNLVIPSYQFWESLVFVIIFRPWQNGYPSLRGKLVNHAGRPQGSPLHVREVGETLAVSRPFNTATLSPTRGNREEWLYGSTMLFQSVLAPSRADRRRPALAAVVAQLPQFWSTKPQYHLGEQAARHPCVCQLAPPRGALDR